MGRIFGSDPYLFDVVVEVHDFRDFINQVDAVSFEAFRRVFVTDDEGCLNDRINAVNCVGCQVLHVFNRSYFQLVIQSSRPGAQVFGIDRSSAAFRTIRVELQELWRFKSTYES